VEYIVNVGDKVMMSPMWKYKEATGVIKKVTKDYVVITWNNINGEWHYTFEQAKRLNIITDSEKDNETN